MDSYIGIIKTSIIFFPFIALLMSIPFILIQYHKYGSISLFKTIIIYSFSLYMLCAYFLVILPLPKISDVALMTTARVQLIPFSFILDFIRNTSFNITNIHSYLGALKEPYFYVPAYNLFLTLPFGMYLRYYYKCSLKKTVILTFLLSLFYELTQLSGLYFIYPRGYRLFDVDDLMLNTLGGLLGYFTVIPFMKILPTRDKIDFNAREKGQKISGFRRTTMLLLDLFIYIVFELLLELILPINTKYIIIITSVLYYFVIPIFLKCSTLGEKFLNIKVTDYNGLENILRLFLRNILFIMIYFIIPYSLYKLIYFLNVESNLKELIGASFIGFILLLYTLTAIRYFFTSKPLLYERLSKTKLLNTIKK